MTGRQTPAIEGRLLEQAANHASSSDGADLIVVDVALSCLGRSAWIECSQ